MLDDAAGLRITHIDEVGWQEVKAQLHGDRRVSIFEKYLEWTPERMVLYARYDPGMVVERHAHRSDHIVWVIAGDVDIGGRPCPPGTCVVLEEGTAFGPIEAGADGALLLEIMVGDPRAVPADPEGFARLCAERGIRPLPNPPFEAPPWFGPRLDE